MASPAPEVMAEKGHGGRAVWMVSILAGEPVGDLVNLWPCGPLAEMF